MGLERHKWYWVLGFGFVGTWRAASEIEKPVTISVFSVICAKNQKFTNQNQKS